jgi:hypothetical protein
MKWLDTPSKVLIFAATIAALTWTVIQIVDWYDRPSEELTALITSSTFYLPPTIETRFSELIARDENSESNVDEMENAELELSNLKECQSQWRIAVQNSGQTTLNEVTLRLPFDCLVKLDYPDKNPESYKTTGTVKIGNLSPQESVFVTCWTYQSDSSYLSKQISIVHQHGIGKVSRMIAVQDTKFGFWGEHPYILAALVFFVTIFIEDKLNNSEKPRSRSKAK